MNNTNQISQTEIAAKISGVYQGDIVVSNREEPSPVLVYVETLSDVLAGVTFSIDNRKFSYRAILSEDEGDVHMIIQEKVTEEYILNGVTGFLCKKPNVHGGYISNLGGFYFHILLNHFGGSYLEMYFFGKGLQVRSIAV